MSVFVNDGGVEKEAKMIYVNDGGIDKLVAGGGVEPDFPPGDLFVDFGVNLFTQDSVARIRYGNGMFLAVGGSGRCSTSFDGINWTKNIIPSTSNLSGAAYHGGLWVAAGQGNSIRTSVDGETWVVRESPFSGGSHYLYPPEFLNGKWYIGTVGRAMISSSDGVSWSIVKDSVGLSYLSSYAYGNGIYVAVGSSGALATSTDGLTWTDHGEQALPGGQSTKRANRIIFYKGRFIAVGQSASSDAAAGALVWTSTNGIDWAHQSLGFGSGTGLKDVFEVGDSIVAVGYGGMLLRSPDGLSWVNGTAINSTSSSFTSVCYGDGILVVTNNSEGSGGGVSQAIHGISGMRWD